MKHGYSHTRKLVNAISQSVAARVHSLASPSTAVSPFITAIAEVEYIRPTPQRPVSSYDQSICGLSNHRPFSLFDSQYVNGLNKLQRSWRL
jgi:hypothetical protein